MAVCGAAARLEDHPAVSSELSVDVDCAAWQHQYHYVAQSLQ